MAITTDATSQTLDLILAKHFEARGGLEKINQLRSVIMHGRSVSDPFEIPIHFYCLQGEGFKVELELEGKTYFQTGTTTEGWSYSPGQDDSIPKLMTAEELQKGQQYFDMHGPFVDYNAKGNKVIFVGKIKLEGKNCFHLRVTSKLGQVTNHYLDENYLVYQTVEFLTGEAEKKIIYSNYKPVSGGLILPFTWRIAESVTQIDSIIINPPMTTSFFIPAK